MTVATPIPPINATVVNNANNVTPVATQQELTSTNPTVRYLADLSLSNQPITNAELTFAQTLSSQGINFTPTQNPLNIYANYTYHIRFSVTSEGNAYNVDGSPSTTNTLGKLIIAESGVTAGFNITDFEYTNYPSPGDKHMNTTSTNWSMTIVEPYGLTLFDKLYSSGIVVNWSLAPYFIETWFDGYNVDGTLMQSNLFYVVNRVTISDVGIKISQGGGVYSLTGYFDGDIGHSNEISIPPAKFTITATTVGDFFTSLAAKLNVQTTDVNTNNPTTPLITYVFNIPTQIANFPFKASQIDQTSQRSADMIITPENGVTSISMGHGASIENIINAVISTCPAIDDFVRGKNSGGDGNSTLSSTGLAQWFTIHSAVKITGFDKNYTKDYVRTVTYSVVPYKTVIGPSDVATITQLQSSSTQQSKVQTLIGLNALVKEYDYIYTGLNTEVINLDLSIDSAWQITMPQWSGLNTHYNYTIPPLYNNGAGNQWTLGTYNISTGSSIQDFNSGGTGSGSTTYLEDVQIGSTNVFTFPLVIRQLNKPHAPNTDVSTDANPAMPNGNNIPPSRAVTGYFINNLVGNNNSFLNIEIEIRGDPYWLGNGNIIDNQTALNFGKSSGQNSSGDIRYNFLASTIMFFLSFRSGSNYDPNTGLMPVTASNNMYSGLYGVTEVTNTFSNGNFTQKLKAYKDPFSQNLGSNSGSQSGGIGHQ